MITDYIHPLDPRFEKAPKPFNPKVQIDTIKDTIEDDKGNDFSIMIDYNWFIDEENNKVITTIVYDPHPHHCMTKESMEDAVQELIRFYEKPGLLFTETPKKYEPVYEMKPLKIAI